MTNLLVSVRSAEEAEAALAGGAGLIDVKEPNHGALGFAGEDVIEEVLRVVDGRCPVSAALGELSSRLRLSARGIRDASSSLIPRALSRKRLAFAKWGLAGCDTWAHELTQVAAHLPTGCRPVAVAYADWQRAKSRRRPMSVPSSVRGGGAPFSSTPGARTAARCSIGSRSLLCAK